jgi:hypothetical protein
VKVSHEKRNCETKFINICKMKKIKKMKKTKKKMLGGVIVLIIAAVATWNVNLN